MNLYDLIEKTKRPISDAIDNNKEFPIILGLEYKDFDGQIFLIKAYFCYWNNEFERFSLLWEDYPYIKPQYFIPYQKD